MKQLPHLLAAAAAALLLAACGDNPADAPAPPEPPPPPTNEVPASATASPQAFSHYAASLAKSETGQPLDVSKVVPPTSETAAPEAL